MSGRILIVDTVPTHRIVLKVKLLAAHYRVEAVGTIDEARAQLVKAQTDLLIVDLAEPFDDTLGFCRSLRQNADTANLPILATGAPPEQSCRIAALTAGIDDFIDRPLNDAVLTARIRSLLRGRNAASELRLREDTHRALGFAEAAPEFERLMQVAVVSHDLVGGQRIVDALGASRLARAVALDPDTLLSGKTPANQADLFIIDAGGPELARARAARITRLVAELRSRGDSRLAAQLVLVPRGADDLAAAALDTGADAVAAAGAGGEEIVLRAGQLLARKAQNDRLRDTISSGLDAALTDPLTGLFNRRYARPHLARMRARAEQTGVGFSVLMIDIDHFKLVNDRYGHAAGDTVLCEVAQRLRENFRAVDLVARIGGEEFLVALPDAGLEQALRAAERLRRVVGATACGADGDQVPVWVTVSVGVATSTSDEEPDHVIARADAALYDAKLNGRNRVTHAA